MAAAVSLVLAGAALPSPAAAADPGVPVRVRIIKGSRQGPAAIDVSLKDLAGQLGQLAYQRWEELGQQQRTMQFKKAEDFPLPDGTVLTLVLEEARKDTVTFQAKVAAGKSTLRFTISKDQRIVQQVANEKDGVAYFASIRPWPG
jgi:hypothetical protein